MVFLADVSSRGHLCLSPVVFIPFVALEGLLPALLSDWLWLLCVSICFVLKEVVVSNLSFCTLRFFFSLLPPLFSLLCLIFVVLGDTYNIPLDPRGKQTYPQVPFILPRTLVMHVNSLSSRNK